MLGQRRFWKGVFDLRYFVSYVVVHILCLPLNLGRPLRFVALCLIPASFESKNLLSMGP